MDRGLICIHENFDDPEFERDFVDGSSIPKCADTHRNAATARALPC